MTIANPEQSALADRYATALADLLVVSGQRWQRGRRRGDKVEYDDVPPRDMTVADLRDHVLGHRYIALASGSDDTVIWLGCDLDTRDEPVLAEAIRSLEDEIDLPVLACRSRVG